MTARADVIARGGIVASSHALAVSAGLEILRKGGTAFDAAIATSAVLAVVEPSSSHLGGDAFVITHRKRDRENLAFNGSGEAPHSAVRSSFTDHIPLHGYKSATVPGLVSTWFAIHEYGGSLPIADLLAQAIEYAEAGFPTNRVIARRVSAHATEFPELFKEMGIQAPLGAGDLVTQPNLARSLKVLASEGRAGFYEGEIARRLIENTAGWFSAEDLRNHTTRVLPPLSINYRDHVIHGQPPPSQGMILMEELLIAQGFDLARATPAERIHLMVEAKKIAFSDRNSLLGDPEKIEVGLEKLFSADSIANRRAQIDTARANNQPTRVNQEGNDTTYFLVADREGNALSWIQSVFHSFGASWAIPGTGIILNNRLTGFSLDSSSPNFIAPGARPAHTLNAWTATRSDGSLALVGGTPGANIQVQTNFQLVVNALDLKMSPQANVEAPRWQHLNRPFANDDVEDFRGVLQVENRIPYPVLAELKRRGHQLQELPAFGHGSTVQLLEVRPDGTYIAGSDPRSEGLAAGY